MLSLQTKNFKPGDRIRVKNQWDDSCEFLEGKVMTTYTENGNNCAEVFVEKYGNVCVVLADIFCREFLFGVSMSGLGAVCEYRIAEETSDAFILADGTIIEKNRCGLMEKSGVRYFVNEDEAIACQNRIQYNCRSA